MRAGWTRKAVSEKPNAEYDVVWGEGQRCQREYDLLQFGPANLGRSARASFGQWEVPTLLFRLRRQCQSWRLHYRSLLERNKATGVLLSPHGWPRGVD